MQGLVLQSCGVAGPKGQYRRIGAFMCIRNGGIAFGKQFKSALSGRGNAAEKLLLDDYLFEDYDEENDRYTFSII
jgi:hypothetical protein